jgi:hypothetical protein
MAFQPWKPGREADAAAAADRASVGPWLSSHGNAVDQLLHRPALLASMGPWLSRHGNPVSPVRPKTLSVCFNGAMACQPWKPGDGWCRATGWRQRFNGAMAVQPWKPGRGMQPLLLRSGLQWGHGLPAMETDRQPAWRRHRCAASMGPWPSSHGNLRIHRRAGSADRASMGPWPSSHGNGQNLRGVTRADQASMGPWPSSHGNGYFRCSGKSCAAILPKCRPACACARLLKLERHFLFLLRRERSST